MSNFGKSYEEGGARKQKDATIFESKRTHTLYNKAGLSSLFSHEEAHIEMNTELEIKWCS